MQLRSPIKLAILMSIALHAVLGSWTLRRDRLETGMLKTPALPEQKVVVAVAAAFSCVGF